MSNRLSSTTRRSFFAAGLAASAAALFAAIRPGKALAAGNAAKSGTVRVIQYSADGKLVGPSPSRASSSPTKSGSASSRPSPTASPA